MRKYTLIVSLIALCLLATALLAQNEPPQRFAVWSPNGQARAVVTNHALLVYHAGQPGSITIPADDRFTAVQFSDSGALLAAWDRSQIVSVWNAATGEPIARLSYADGRGSVRTIRFARQDQVVAFYYYDLTQFMAGKRIARQGERSRTQSPTPTPSNPTRTYPSGVFVWEYDIDTEPQTTPLAVYRGDSSLYLSPDATAAATASYGSQNRTGFLILSIPVVNLQTGELITHLGGMNYELRALEFNPAQPSHVAVLSENGVVRFSDLYANTGSFALTLLPGRIRAMAFSLDGKTLATGGVDGKVRLWDTETGAMLEVYTGRPADIHQLRFDAAGALIAFGDPLDYPRTWNAKTLETISDFRPPRPTPTPTATFPTLAPWG